MPGGAFVKSQDNRRAPLIARIIRKAGRPHEHLVEAQGQLLGDFPAQGKARIFLDFHLATGEFP